MRGTGVDGARGGWVFVTISRGGFGWGTASHFQEVVDACTSGSASESPGRICVDMPVGLTNAPPGGRDADRLARKALGPRRSSVFPTPARATLSADTYEDAKRLNRRTVGSAISRQAFGILPKIREVDAVMQAHARARNMVYEAHPEVCFWALAGAQPMEYPKRTPAGFEERATLLEHYVPGAREAIAAAWAWGRSRGVARDDVVDAFVNALAASAEPDDFLSFPDVPPLDDTGLPMRICYATQPGYKT